MTSDLVTIARARFRESEDHTREWRREARRDFAMVAGDQWSAADKAELEDEERVAAVFNRIAPLIDLVHGQEVVNRTETKYLPRTEGDAKANEILTGAADWARDLSGAEDDESDLFYDMLVCGMGWTETKVDYDDDPDGALGIPRIDPLEMWWDCNARRRSVKDGNWLFHARMVPLSEAQRRWPKGEFTSSGWAGLDTLGEVDHEPIGDKYQQTEPGTAPRLESRVEIIRYQWKEYETRYRVTDPMTGETADLRADGLDEYKAVWEMAGVEAVEGVHFVKVRRASYKQAWFSGDNLLEEGDCPVAAFSYTAATGKRDRNKATWYGLVRAMIDPQRWSNTFFSVLLSIFSGNAKGGNIIETDAVDSPEEFENQWNDSRSNVWVRPGANSTGKIREKTASPYPASLDRLMEFAVAALPEVTGINPELLGMAQVNQPGIVELARKQSGLTIVAGMFDSLRSYRREQGSTMLLFIQRYMTDGRLVQITGEAGPQYVRMATQPDTLKYDVVVNDATNSPNQQHADWQAMKETLAILAPMGALPPVETIIKTAPLPETVKQEWMADRQQQKQAAQGPDPQMQLAQTAAQLEMNKQQQQAAKDQAQMQLDAAEFAHKRDYDWAKLMQGERQDVRDAEVDLAKARMGKVPDLRVVRP